MLILERGEENRCDVLYGAPVFFGKDPAFKRGKGAGPKQQKGRIPLLSAGRPLVPGGYCGIRQAAGLHARLFGEQLPKADEEKPNGK